MYRTREQARADVLDYIERFHNPARHHSTLDYVSPMQFEKPQEAQVGVHDSGSSPVQLLSRILRLARIRWGLTTFNPCDAIEYLPESPLDQYVSDDRYAEIYAAASPILQCMLEISTQTGAREGMGNSHQEPSISE